MSKLASPSFSFLAGGASNAIAVLLIATIGMGMLMGKGMHGMGTGVGVQLNVLLADHDHGRFHCRRNRWFNRLCSNATKSDVCVLLRCGEHDSVWFSAASISGFSRAKRA